VHSERRLCLPGGCIIAFDPRIDLRLDGSRFLPQHPNGLVLRADWSNDARSLTAWTR